VIGGQRPLTALAVSQRRTQLVGTQNRGQAGREESEKVM
jgi:hypothetical protein